MPAKPTEQRPQLTDIQIQQIADIFDEVDEDRDGFITRRQLSELLERLEISVELQKKLNRHLEQLGMTSKDVLSRVEVLKLVKKLMLKELQQHKSRYEQLKGWFDGEPDEVPRPATGFFPRSTIERNQVAAAQDVEASAGANNNNAENSDFEYYSYASDSADELIPQPSAPDVQIQRTAIINHDDATNSPFVPDKRLSISGAAEKRQEEPLTHTTTSHRRKTPSEQRAALAHSRKRDLTKGEKSNLDRKKMRMKILMDPKVRSQLVKKKIYDAFFLQLVTLVQILMLAYEIYINGGLESFSVNPFGGPSTLTLVQLGAKYVPCMRPDPMIIGNPEVTCNPKYPGAGEFIKLPNGNCSYYLNLKFVCGMTPFTTSNKPDQIWRFITPLFVHNGFIHLLLCLVIQFKIGFTMEYQLGFLRTGFVFFASGISGYLFAALMGTKDVSAGGNAALYGFIAMLYLDLLQNWPITIRPWVELSKTSMVVLVALAIGLLPFIDNYAHIGGFLGGLFSGMAVMPTISYTNSDRRRKRILRILSIPILIGLMSGGFYMFFSGSNIDCPWCTYLDCVPPGASWCSTNSS